MKEILPDDNVVEMCVKKECNTNFERSVDLFSLIKF